MILSKEQALYLLEIRLSHLGERIEFLTCLMQGRRHHESLLLCCCYIEALGAFIYASEDLRGRQVFVRVLREHGGDPYLPLVHPRQLMIMLNRLGRRSRALAAIRQAIDPILEGCALVTEDDFLAAARRYLSVDQHARLAGEIWRGTMASIGYELRSVGVHEGGGPSGMSFGDTTYEGREAPMVNYEMLWPALNRIHEAAKGMCAHVNLS